MKIWHDKETFQDMEDRVLNCEEIHVKKQDMKFLQHLEAQHHTQYIIKPSVQEKKINKYINYIIMYFSNSC